MAKSGGGKQDLKPQEVRPEQVYDYMCERPLLFSSMGFGRHSSLLYRAYVFCLLAFLAFTVVLSVKATFVAEDMEVICDAIHSINALTVTFFNLLNLRLRTKDLYKSRDIVLSGFYKYEDEELDEEAQRILWGTREDIQQRQRRFSLLMGSSVVVQVFLFSGMQGFLTTEEEYESLVDTCDPYLPLCMLLPFSTRGFLGWALGYLIHVLCVSLIFGIANAGMEIYVGVNMQLYTQLALLNNSILRVFQRADRLYGKSSQRPHPDHEACLHRCIRANIQHYHHLRRFLGYTKKYQGTLLLIIVMLSAFVVGPRVYLLIKGNLSFGKLMTFTLSSFFEQSYWLYLCYYGQKVMDESMRLGESLYAIPWYESNKSFNRTLHIFMLMTKEPMKIEALPFHLAANMKTFGDLIAAVYKVSNILRQFDKV